jgi:peptidoglycan/LPS O-acetylase OafA/YrhL
MNLIKKINYRPEIDALRGFAIIFLILYHAKISFFSGGYFGVDIFFVLSGYLITTIIINNYKKNNFLINFYERRIRRIIPALSVMLFFCSIYVFFFQSPYFAKDTSQSIFASSLFLQNFLLIYEFSDYFNLNTELKPLFHLWSLSIEEQFYIFFPVIFLYLLKFYKKFFLSFFIVITLFISLALNYYLENNSIYNYYLPLTRAWELLLGSWLAINNFRKRNIILLLIGIIFIFFSIFLTNYYNNLNFLFRVLVVIGTSMFIVFYDNKNFYLNLTFENKFIIYIGLISFSLYLWHLPIIAIFNDLLNFSLDKKIIILVLLLSFFIASLSHRYVELPFRNINFLSQKNIFKLFFIAIFLFVLFGLFGHLSDGFEKTKIKNFSEIEKKIYVSDSKEKQNKSTLINLIETKLINNQNNKSILVVGDSMAEDIKNSLAIYDIVVERYSVNGGCFVKLVSNGNDCGIILVDFINKINEYEIIILASDWVNEDSVKGAHYLYLKIKESKINGKVFVLSSLNIKYLSASSFQYVKYKYYNRYNLENFLYSTLDPRNFKNNFYLKNFITSEDFIDKEAIFCNHDKRICKFYSPNLKPYFFDTKHFTVEGLKFFGNILIKKYINTDDHFFNLM